MTKVDLAFQLNAIILAFLDELKTCKKENGGSRFKVVDSVKRPPVQLLTVRKMVISDLANEWRSYWWNGWRRDMRWWST